MLVFNLEFKFNERQLRLIAERREWEKQTIATEQACKAWIVDMVYSTLRFMEEFEGDPVISVSAGKRPDA